MLETITATVIAELAFKKFLESGAGELGKQFTTAAIGKMDELRQLIWNRLKGNHKVEVALTAVENGNKDELSRVSSYLQVEMDKDDDFCQQVQQLAQDIIDLRINQPTILEQKDQVWKLGYKLIVFMGGGAFLGGIFAQATGVLIGGVIAAIYAILVKPEEHLKSIKVSEVE